MKQINLLRLVNELTAWSKTSAVHEKFAAVLPWKRFISFFIPFSPLLPYTEIAFYFNSRSWLGLLDCCFLLLRISLLLLEKTSRCELLRTFRWDLFHSPSLSLLEYESESKRAEEFRFYSNMQYSLSSSLLPWLALELFEMTWELTQQDFTQMSIFQLVLWKHKEVQSL